MSEQVIIDWAGQTTGSAHSLSQEALWIEAARKDLSAFEPLYRKYYEQIYAFVYRRIEDKDDVLDVTSLVFEKAMLNLNKYVSRGWSFGSWLYRIALSETGNYYRKNARAIKVSLSSEGIQLLCEDMDDLSDRRELQTRLLNALQALKPEDMELVLLRYVEKLPYQVLADMRQTTENALRVKLHRILESLKTKLLKP